MKLVMTMNRIYLCIDLKTFYASVECIERGLDPFQTDLIVADPSRAVGAICLAISPKMKERGIKNRCRVYEIPKEIKPIVAKPRMKKYMEYSARIYQIYLKYISKEDIHVYSIDEAFLDITNYLKLYQKSPEELAQMILKDILDETKLTATVGIGTNLFLAKIALDIIAKHNENHLGYLNEELFQKKLGNHTPLTDFWQIGKGIAKRLDKYHIKTMNDICQADPYLLYKEFGIEAEFLIDHAHGRETCTIKEIKEYHPKSNSFSNSQILYEDYDEKRAKVVLIEMLDSLLSRLILYEATLSKVCVYIGYSKDKIPGLKYSISWPQKTDYYHDILDRVTKEYNEKVSKTVPIRKIGISFHGIERRKVEQLSLFEDLERKEGDRKMKKVMNQIQNKFGKSAIFKAISLSSGGTQLERNKLIGGHNAE